MFTFILAANPNPHKNWKIHDLFKTGGGVLLEVSIQVEIRLPSVVTWEELDIQKHTLSCCHCWHALHLHECFTLCTC